MSMRSAAIGLICFLILGVLLLGAPQPARAATCTNTAGGAWTNAGIWDCGFVPAPTDDVNLFLQVFINVGVSVERRGATTIPNNGSLVIDGTLTNYGTLTKTGPFINNGTITNYGTMVFNTAMTNSGTIINCGAITGVMPGGTVLNGPCPNPLSSLVEPPCVNDGRLNSICADPWATAVLFCQPNGELHIYRIDSDNNGIISFVVTPEEIEQTVVPTDADAALIDASEDGAIRVYRLSNGRFQLNAPYMDAVHGLLDNGYVYRWEDVCPV